MGAECWLGGQGMKYWEEHTEGIQHLDPEAEIKTSKIVTNKYQGGFLYNNAITEVCIKLKYHSSGYLHRQDKSPRNIIAKHGAFTKTG